MINKRIYGNLLKIFSGTMVSRFFGFVREMVTGAYLGTSSAADAITIALMFPNLFRQILGEDMVERAFMPPFKTIYDKGNPTGAWRFVSVLFNWFFFSLLIVLFFLYLIIPLFFRQLEDLSFFEDLMNTNKEIDYQLTLEYIMIILPYMVFIGIGAFIGSLLNFFEKNWIFAFAPVSLSLGVIISIKFFHSFLGIYSIAAGYLLGAFLQMIVQIPFLLTKEFKEKFSFQYFFICRDTHQDFSIIKRESKIITLNSIFNKSSEVFGRFLALFLTEGAASSIFYAQRLLQLPFAIVSLSISRALNPILNQLKEAHQKDEFTLLFGKGVSLNVMIFIPVSAVMIAGAEEIINIIYVRGNFQMKSLLLTGAVLRWYSAGLLFMGLTAYFTRVLSLFQKNRHSLYISIISAGMNILTALLFIKLFNAGHEAIAAANSLAFFVNTVFLIFIVKKEFYQYHLNFFHLFKKYITGALITIILLFVIEFMGMYFFQSKITSVFSLIIKSVIFFGISGVFLLFSRMKKKQIKKI